jgi:hypothetical protein
MRECVNETGGDLLRLVEFIQLFQSSELWKSWVVFIHSMTQNYTMKR